MSASASSGYLEARSRQILDWISPCLADDMAATSLGQPASSSSASSSHLQQQERRGSNPDGRGPPRFHPTKRVPRRHCSLRLTLRAVIAFTAVFRDDLFGSSSARELCALPAAVAADHLTRYDALLASAFGLRRRATLPAQAATDDDAFDEASVLEYDPTLLATARQGVEVTADRTLAFCTRRNHMIASVLSSEQLSPAQRHLTRLLHVALGNFAVIVRDPRMCVLRPLWSECRRITAGPVDFVQVNELSHFCLPCHRRMTDSSVGVLVANRLLDDARQLGDPATLLHAEAAVDVAAAEYQKTLLAIGDPSAPSDNSGGKARFGTPQTCASQLSTFWRAALQQLHPDSSVFSLHLTLDPASDEGKQVAERNAALADALSIGATGTRAHEATGVWHNGAEPTTCHPDDERPAEVPASMLAGMSRLDRFVHEHRRDVSVELEPDRLPADTRRRVPFMALDFAPYHRSDLNKQHHQEYMRRAVNDSFDSVATIQHLFPPHFPLVDIVPPMWRADEFCPFDEAPPLSPPSAWANVVRAIATAPLAPSVKTHVFPHDGTLPRYVVVDPRFGSLNEWLVNFATPSKEHLALRQRQHSSNGNVSRFASGRRTPDDIDITMLCIVRDVCDALHALHSGVRGACSTPSGVAHLNLRPAVVFLINVVTKRIDDAPYLADTPPQCAVIGGFSGSRLTPAPAQRDAVRVELREPGNIDLDHTLFYLLHVCVPKATSDMHLEQWERLVRGWQQVPSAVGTLQTACDMWSVGVIALEYLALRTGHTSAMAWDKTRRIVAAQARSTVRALIGELEAGCPPNSACEQLLSIAQACLAPVLDTPESEFVKGPEATIASVSQVPVPAPGRLASELRSCIVTCLGEAQYVPSSPTSPSGDEASSSRRFEPALFPSSRPKMVESKLRDVVRDERRADDRLPLAELERVLLHADVARDALARFIGFENPAVELTHSAAVTVHKLRLRDEINGSPAREPDPFFVLQFPVKRLQPEKGLAGYRHAKATVLWHPEALACLNVLRRITRHKCLAVPDFACRLPPLGDGLISDPVALVNLGCSRPVMDVLIAREGRPFTPTTAWRWFQGAAEGLNCMHEAKAQHFGIGLQTSELVVSDNGQLARLESVDQCDSFAHLRLTGVVMCAHDFSLRMVRSTHATLESEGPPFGDVNPPSTQDDDNYTRDWRCLVTVFLSLCCGVDARAGARLLRLLTVHHYLLQRTATPSSPTTPLTPGGTTISQGATMVGVQAPGPAVTQQQQQRDAVHVVQALMERRVPSNRVKEEVCRTELPDILKSTTPATTADDGDQVSSFLQHPTDDGLMDSRWLACTVDEYLSAIRLELDDRRRTNRTTSGSCDAGVQFGGIWGVLVHRVLTNVFSLVDVAPEFRGLHGLDFERRIMVGFMCRTTVAAAPDATTDMATRLRNDLAGSLVALKAASQALAWRGPDVTMRTILLAQFNAMYVYRARQHNLECARCRAHDGDRNLAWQQRHRRVSPVLEYGTDIFAIPCSPVRRCFRMTSEDLHLSKELTRRDRLRAEAAEVIATVAGGTGLFHDVPLPRDWRVRIQASVEKNVEMALDALGTVPTLSDDAAERTLNGLLDVIACRLAYEKAVVYWPSDCRVGVRVLRTIDEMRVALDCGWLMMSTLRLPQWDERRWVQVVFALADTERPSVVVALRVPAADTVDPEVRRGMVAALRDAGFVVPVHEYMSHGQALLEANRVLEGQKTVPQGAILVVVPIEEGGALGRVFTLVRC